MGVPLFGEDHEDHPARRHEHPEPALQPYIRSGDGAEQGGGYDSDWHTCAGRRPMVSAPAWPGVAYDDPKHPEAAASQNKCAATEAIDRP